MGAAFALEEPTGIRLAICAGLLLAHIRSRESVTVAPLQGTQSPGMAKSKKSLTAEDRQLVESQVQLVKTIANSLARRLPASVERSDLIQDGALGVMEALLRWTKETTGAHFENYVALRAHGAMLDGLRALDPGSRQVRKEMRRVEQAIQSLGHTHGRFPREREIADVLGITLPAYQKLLQDAQGYLLISLQDLAGEEEEAYLEHCINENADPLVVLERSGLRVALANAVKLLTKQKQTLLKLYYEDDLKMREIAEKLSLSEARISQLHTQTIAELRAAMPDGDINTLLKPRRKPRAESGATAPAPL